MKHKKVLGSTGLLLILPGSLPGIYSADRPFAVYEPERKRWLWTF